MSEETRSLAARVASGAKASFGGRALYIASNAVLILLLTRELLTPTVFGRLYFVVSVLGVVSMFAVLGLPKSAARYVNQYAERDPGQVRYIIRVSVLMLSALAVAVSTGLVLASDRLAVLLGDPAAGPLLALGGLYVAVYALHSQVVVLFQAFNRVEWSATVTALSGVVRLVLAVALVLAGLEAAGALLGYIGGYAIAVVVGAVVLYRRYYRQLEPADSPEEGLVRRIVEYSVPLTATKGAGVLDKRVDIILVGTLLNPAAVSYYVISKQISEFASIAATSFGYSVSPAYGEQKASDRVERAARLYENSVRYTLLLYVPAAVGLVLVADPTVTLVFGDQYAPAVPVVQVMSGFVLVNAVNKVTSDGLDYLGKARSRAVMKTVTATANFLLNLLLIPVFGVVGAAVATVITYTAYTGGNVYQIHTELELDIRSILRDTVVVCLIAAAMAAVVVFAVPYVSGPLTLAGVVALGGGVWAVLSVASGFVDVRAVVSLLLEA